MRKQFLSLSLLLVLVAVAFAPAVAQDFEPMSYTAGDCDYGGIIQTIEAIDEFTVQFTLCVPDPALPSKVAFSAFPIFPSEQIEGAADAAVPFWQDPIGTGPYTLDNWDLGNEIVMTRFDGYWGTPAIEGTLIFRWNSEATARLVELQAGTIDGMDNPGPDDFALIRGDDNLILYDRLGTNVFYLGMTNTLPPMDNLLVRQAIAHAIDKQRIVDNYYPPGSVIATQFMPPAIPSGYTPDVEPFPYDPDRARELLAESGLELPLEVTLYYRDVVRSYLPTPGLVATDIQAQLGEVGINVTIEVQESGTFIDNSDSGLLMLHMLGWGADYPDATNFLDFHFGAGASDQFGEKHPEITEPLAAAAQLSDFDARQEIYAEANIALRDIAPMVPIAHGGSGTAYRSVIEGGHASPLGNEYFAVMSDPDDDNFIWMQNAEPIGLNCQDETDGESLRACEQIMEQLLAYEVGGTAVVPSLAESYEANDELTVWTFHLREGVVFHDGSMLDANDVVLSYAVVWDADHPMRDGVARDGGFTYFSAFWYGFMGGE